MVHFDDHTHTYSHCLHETCFYIKRRKVLALYLRHFVDNKWQQKQQQQWQASEKYVCGKVDIMFVLVFHC